MLHPDPRGFLMLLAVTMCWALAVVVYRSSIRGSAARKLSVLLVIEGITLASSSAIAYFLDSPSDLDRPDSAIGHIMGSVHTLGDCAMLALYPPFLVAALNTSLTRPFEDRRVQVGLAVVAAVLFVAVMMADFDWRRSSGTGLLPVQITLSILYLAMALVFWYALAVSIHAWYTSRGTARTRAGYFAVAFGIQYVCWSANYIIALLELWSLVPAPVANEVPSHFMIYILGTLVAVPLIAYGILRTQLFDIDLRIRWTIKQSTVAAAVVAFVYLVSEGASRLLSSELGNVAGLLAADANALERDLQAGSAAPAPALAS